jgi:hypothetical protein
MIKVTGAVALNLLRYVVKEKGSDYVYVNPRGGSAREGASCYYVHEAVTEDGGAESVPGCIVGTALHKLGVGFSVMLSEENNSSDSLLEAIMMGRSERDENGEPKFHFTETAKHVFRAAQSQQDRGHNWGDALQSATADYVSYKTGNGMSYQERQDLLNMGILYYSL